VSFPDGRLIDRVATASLPQGLPCWFPGAEARVLFTEADGQLYRHDFEPPPGQPAAAPRTLAWLCPKPGGGEVQLSEPFWPADPRFARMIVVILQTVPRPGTHGFFSPRRPWWLRLNDDGNAIEEAGPLVDLSSMPDALEVHAPMVGPAPGGNLVLAAFSGPGDGSWDLRITPLTLDASGRPRPTPGLGATLAGHCQAMFPPAFSNDGRWVSAVQSGDQGRGTILRLDLAARPTPAALDPAGSPPQAGAPPRVVLAGD
jgi:hypothetical protein